MKIKQIALIILLTLILLPVQSAFASRTAARTFSARPFNSAQAATPTAIPPTAGGLSTTPAPTAFTPTAPPLSLTLMLGFTCLALVLVVGVLVVGVMAGATNRQEAEKKTKK